MKNILFTAILFLGLYENNVQAQWVRTNGPYADLMIGAHVRCMTHTLDKQRLIAGTTIGLFMSKNNGESWEPITNSIPDNDFYAVATDSAGRLYASCNPGGTYISADNGDSWMGAGIGIVESFAASASAVFAGTDYGFFKSTDGGEHWTASGLNGIAILTISVYGTTILAGAYSGGNGIGGVYKSTDGGMNWVHSLDSSIEVRAVLQNESHIIAGSGNAIFVSTNGGLSWQNTSGYNYVAALEHIGGVIFAGTSKGIYRSTNTGISWENTGYNAFVDEFLVIEDHIFAGGTGVSVSIDDGNTWESRNHGMAMPHVLSLKAFTGAAGNYLLAGLTFLPGNGVYRSTDHGETWSLLSDTIYATEFAVSGNTIFAAHNGTGGIARSTNNGVSWEMVNDGLTDLNITKLATSPDGFVFAGSSKGHIFLSTNNGSSWNDVTDTSRFQGDITALAFNDSILYVGTSYYEMSDCCNGGKRVHSSQKGGVYTSYDFGGSWRESGLSGRNIYSFAFRGKSVYAGGIGAVSITRGDDVIGYTYKSGGVYCLSGDTSWTEINSGIQDENGKCLVYDIVANENQLFARTISGTIYSYDEDVSEWLPIGSNVPISSWGKLAVDSYFLYASTNYHGIWKSAFFQLSGDTLSPNLTLAALSTPAVNAVRFGIGANEFLTSAELTVNSQPVTLTKEGDLYFGTYFVNSPGQLNVHASATDLSSNTTQTDRSYTVVDLNKSGSFLGFTMKSEDKGYAVLSTSESPQAPSNWEPISSAIEVLNTNPVADITIEALYADFNHADESKIGLYEYLNGNWEYAGGHGKNGKVTTTIHGGKIAVFYNPDQTSVPKDFSLGQNYPNPFNPTTTLRYNVATAGKVTMKVYNILGQEVRTLVNAVREPGFYEVMWDGRSDTGSQVSSGVYIYRMEAGKFIQTRKMLFVK